MPKSATPAPVMPASVMSGQFGLDRAVKSTVAQIRQAREQIFLRSKSAPDLDYRLLAMFVRNELLASLAIPVLAVVVAVALMSWAPANQLLLWLAVVFISKGVLLLLCRQFGALARERVDVGLWRRRLASAEFFYGVAWAAVAFVDIAPGEKAAFYFLFALIMVVVAIRMIFALTVMPVIYAGTIPLTAALVLRFMLTGDAFFWTMAAVAIGIHIYLIFLVKELNFTVLAMLGYRAEKDALIGELEQAMAVSDEARKRAEDANIAKSKFLATMSHELRTPLNAILGFSEVMKGEMLGPMGNPAYRGYAGDIHESGQHLLKLINEVLDISRIEAGRYELSERPVQLDAVARDCHRLMRLRADSKGLKIVENIIEPQHRLWADERALRQICLNLLSNAIKFTPAGGNIVLSAGTNPAGEQFLSVRDDGPGIPESEIPCVLSAFGQGKLAQTIAEGGAGLGLPIVQGLVKLHGGKFDFKTSLGQGTEIIVSFPKPRVMQIQPMAAGQDEPPAAPDTASQAAALRQICEGAAMACEMTPSKSVR